MTWTESFCKSSVKVSRKTKTWLQALVNENLDYKDKTKKLEVALSTANIILAGRGIAPQKVPESCQEEPSGDTVQLVVTVTDTQRSLNAETRVIFLWHYVTQMLVSFLHCIHLYP